MKALEEEGSPMHASTVASLRIPPNGVESSEEAPKPFKKMTTSINKVAVLGAGTMGARIAAHVANAGVQCVLLDIAPADAPPAKPEDAAAQNVRNKVVNAGWEGAKKSKPAALFEPGVARYVKTG